MRWKMFIRERNSGRQAIGRENRLCVPESYLDSEVDGCGTFKLTGYSSHPTTTTVHPFTISHLLDWPNKPKISFGSFFESLHSRKTFADLLNERFGYTEGLVCFCDKDGCNGHFKSKSKPPSGDIVSNSSGNKDLALKSILTLNVFVVIITSYVFGVMIMSI